MSVPDTTAAVEYHSKIAVEFHGSYRWAANRFERLRVWNRFIDRYGQNAGLAYDLGCGSGILACEVAKRGIETIAIDGSASMLDLATQTAAQQRLGNISFVRDLLPLANPQAFRQADLLLSSSVMEYLPSIENALRNFQELLRPGGVIIFSVGNRACLGRRLDRIIYRLLRLPRHLRVIQTLSTIEEACLALHAAGLQLVQYQYCEGSEGISRILRHLLPAKYAANMIILAARKPSSPGPRQPETGHRR